MILNDFLFFRNDTLCRESSKKKNTDSFYVTKVELIKTHWPRFRYDLRGSKCDLHRASTDLLPGKFAGDPESMLSLKCAIFARRQFLCPGAIKGQFCSGSNLRSHGFPSANMQMRNCH